MIENTRHPLKGMQDKKLEIKPGFDNRTTELRMAVVSRLMDGMIQMRAPKGSDIYRHGEMVFNVAKLDSAMIGWDPNRAMDVAKHVLEEEEARETEHKAQDHRMVREEEGDGDWKLIRDEFPGQFPEATTVVDFGGDKNDK